ncbi:Glutaminyl-peptide cyclotransferase [Platanthera guangdongensis]|uniref:Glutaminyl-peptide cyclotransferase n=1 Tax=Platanthera guangdongensis TaxID=2320717 RepID=A0ABR2MXG0_9ASPA
MKDGWGLATDGKIIFGSDGSSTLYQLDPGSWEVIKKATVKYNNHEIPLINELEYVNGEVWANVWQTDCIARISQDNGSVLSWILLHELRQNLLRSGHTGIDVLNGIAWDEDNKRLFVTGKLWPKLYQIKLRPLTTPPFDGKIEKLCPTRGFR